MQRMWCFIGSDWQRFDRNNYLWPGCAVIREITLVKKIQIYLIIYSFSLPVFIECPSSLFYLAVCLQAIVGLYKTNNIYRSKMNCELNFHFIICCQPNEWNKRLFMCYTINANIFSLSLLQLFSEID